MVKVSIGLPVYNGDNYLAYAIESVLNQTLEDWELVICDNASEDGTQAICEHYASLDARIKYFRSEKNQGAAWNFNQTFHKSNGQYFRWLCHDDYILADNLQRCAEILDDNPDYISCATATGAIDEQGYRILDDVAGEVDLACQSLTEQSESTRLHYSKSDRKSERYLGILLFSRRCNEIYGLIRRDVFVKTQMHPDYCGGEKVLLAEIALRGKIYELDEMLFYVRWHTERFTATESTREQQEHMATSKPRTFRLPHQYRATLGYLGLLRRVELPITEKARGVVAWLRFVFQFPKWAEILKNTLLFKSTMAEIEGATKRGILVHGEPARLQDFPVHQSEPEMTEKVNQK
ncbi:MAG: glycosyltransferase family 2 protein [Planctomycetota bacterium]